MTGRQLAVLLACAALASAAPVAVAVVPEAPAAKVPTPRTWAATDLYDPGLGDQELLEALAPLGNGAGNAADFLGALRPGGEGAEDLATALERTADVDHGIDRGPALASDDPLLVAAASWVDQGSCAFFPDAVPFVGWETWRVDEELALLFARSWVAEARALNSPEPARRAVRLGRLLLQEDVWFETGLAGRRAIVLGVNELRRQAMAGERWPEALACLHVLSRQQLDWIYTRLRAKDFARRQVEATTSRGREADVFSSASLEQLAERGSERLRVVARLWAATGPTGGDAEFRAAAAGLLADWTHRSDPVVSAAATWWAGREWSPEAALMTPTPPAALEWMTRPSEDPAEAWLGDRVPVSVAWASPPSPGLSFRGPAAGLPEALRHPSRSATREITGRGFFWTNRKGLRRSALPADDPFLIATEAWLLTGADLPPLPDDPRLAGEAQSLLWLAAYSLVPRAESLRGSPAAVRALDACERLLRLLDTRDSGWDLLKVDRRWGELETERAAHALAVGTGRVAVDHATTALGHDLSWWWVRELVGPINAIGKRRIHRSLFGFGPARARIEDGDLDLLEHFAGERSEAAVKDELAGTLHFVSHVGRFSQRRRAERLLVDLSKDGDARVAARAAELLEREFTDEKKDLDTEIADALDTISDGFRSMFEE